MASYPICVSITTSFVREVPLRRSTSTDALLDCAKQGDIHAFDLVRSRFEPALINFVRSYVRGDEHTAHDVVQETFVIAWNKIDTINDGEHLRPWLYRVARFKAISFLRKRGPKGRAMHSLDFAAEHGADYADPRLVDPVRQTANCKSANPWIDAVRNALPRLPPLYVAVMRLFYLEAQTTKEIAELLGLPRTTVKMRLMRGREKLRRLVLEEMDGKEPDWTT